MYTCSVALVHSRVLGKASRPSERYCSLLPPGARARIRGKSRQNINRLPAVRVPTSDVNKCLVAQSPRSTSQAPSQGNTGPKLFQPWLAIDAGGYVMAESQPTAHSPQQHAQLHGSDNLTDRGDLLQRNAETPCWQVGDEPDTTRQPHTI